MEDLLKLILLLSIIIASCAPQSENSEKTQFTVDELIAAEGQPDEKRVNEIDKNTQMYDYSHASYQVKDNAVLMKFKTPKGDETSIQYWRHLFNDDEFKITVYDKTEHTQSYKLINKTQNIEILFNESGKVKRIAQEVGGKNE